MRKFILSNFRDKVRRLPGRQGAGNTGNCPSTQLLYPAGLYLATLQWVPRRSRCQTPDTWCLKIQRNVATCGFYCVFSSDYFSKLKTWQVSYENTKSTRLGSSNMLAFLSNPQQVLFQDITCLIKMYNSFGKYFSFSERKQVVVAAKDADKSLRMGKWWLLLGW